MSDKAPAFLYWPNEPDKWIIVQTEEELEEKEREGWQDHPFRPSRILKKPEFHVKQEPITAPVEPAPIEYAAPEPSKTDDAPSECRPQPEATVRRGPGRPRKT